LVEEGEIERSPAERLKMPPKPKNSRKGISKADRLAMMNVVKDKPRDYALLCFVWETACRRDGVARLCQSDLNLLEMTATVTEKGDKSREVYFTERTVEAMQCWFSYRCTHEHEHVFIGKFGPLTEWGIYDIFKKAAKAANVKKRWSPHQWRHARARYWITQGMSLGLVSQLLGHSNVSVTVEYYGQFDDDGLRDAFKRYSSPDD